MLASKNKLTLNKDFDYVKKNGKVFHSKSFTVSYAKSSKDEDSLRFGFIVSTKIAKEAVARNKVKRGLREGVRQKVSIMQKGYDIVFIAHDVSVKAYTSDLMKEVEESLKKIKLL